MKLQRNFVSLFVPLILLSACVADPILPQGKSEAGAEKKIETCAPPISPDKGRIWLYRTEPKHIGLPPTIYVDNDPLGELLPHYAYYHDIPSGTHEISIGWRGRNKLEVNVGKAQQIIVKFVLDPPIFGKGFYPVLMDDKTGREELKQSTGSDINCAQ